MTIRSKILLSLAIATGLMVSTSVLILSNLFTSRMNKLEIQKATLDTERIDEVLSSEITNLEEKIADWASWDDTYKFIQDKNQDYIKSNLETSASYESLRLSFMIFVNVDGKVVYQVGYNQKTKSIDKVPDGINKYIVKDNFLLKLTDLNDSNSGMLMLPEGMFLVSAKPILTSNSEGPSKGIIIFGRLFDQGEIDNLAKITRQSKISLFPINNLKLNNIEVKITNEKTLEGIVLIKDVFENPIAYFSVNMARDIHAQGVQGTKIITAILILISIIFFIFSWLLLGHLVINPINQIANSVNLVANSKDAKARIIFSGNDELGSLAKDINHMIDSLHLSQKQLSNKSEFIEKVMSNLIIGVAVNEISTGKAIYMNKAFENIYGWNKDILTSVDSFFNNVYPDAEVREKLKKRIISDMESGDPKRMNWEGLEITRSDGEKRFVDAKNISLSDQDLMVSTVIDVTDVMKDKAERIRHTEELERLNTLMTGRELKMIELKKKISEKEGGDIK